MLMSLNGDVVVSCNSLCFMNLLILFCYDGIVLMKWLMSSWVSWLLLVVNSVVLKLVCLIIVRLLGCSIWKYLIRKVDGLSRFFVMFIDIMWLMVVFLNGSGVLRLVICDIMCVFCSRLLLRLVEWLMVWMMVGVGECLSSWCMVWFVL